MMIIKAKAYIPSYSEIKALEEKFPAFVNARASISTKRKKMSEGPMQEFVVRNDPTSFYMLRDLDKTSYNGYLITNREGGVSSQYFKNKSGLRIGLTLKYNPTKQITDVTISQYTPYSAYIGHGDYEKLITSVAPVVIYAGNEYVWTNEEECESGKSKVMNLISFEILDEAPFCTKGPWADYADAEELRARCEEIAFENATEEEKSMVVEVEMSSEDGYSKLIYPQEFILTDEKEDEDGENEN